ncbi:PREDICTED: vicilin-like seed storage protein At4g36700 [Camelina sativa]|uniref:Vicilin-like seed storage protein At4g36700 n=1 Tax=Camelina sativa TaxID=90675 RepID=A0ABM0U804_CAMSA|nr:PREDICTED: vicilin-like seed storage protein At4g36700 [Camelina sativa]
MTRFTVLPLSVLLVLLFLCTQSYAKSEESDENDVAVPSCCGFSSPLLVKNDQWKPIFTSKFGQISTVQIGDGCGGMGPYKIHSITLEPNMLLLPLLLHSDMVFFVDSGSGILNWVEEEARSSEIRRGDVYRLRPGSVFYLQSKPVDVFLGTKLRLYAIFSNNEECLHDPCFGAYSSITELLFGFDETILQSAFGVPEEIIGLMRNRTKPPLIVSDMPCSPPCVANTWQLQPRLLKLFAGSADSVVNKKKKEKVKKAKTFNVFESEPDFESPNGRTITINRKDLKVLKGSMVGVSMVNLTQASMMGPHWNPWACEISIVLKGAGMVRVLRSSISRGSSSSDDQCKNVRFKVEEGDVFAVPRLHPMAQMSFNNDSLVFIGFTTSAKNNKPQFLAGKSSALRMLDRQVLAASFNVSSVTIDGLFEAQKEAVVLECPSCAEGEVEKLKVEMEKKKMDDESKRRRDERKKEEEEAKKEEEERRKREKEEEKKRWPPQSQQPSQEEPQVPMEKEWEVADEEEM